MWPSKLVGQSEIQADGLGVADVQVAVRLGRKASLHAALIFVRLQIFEDDVANEIGRTRLDRIFSHGFGSGISGGHVPFIL